MANSSNIEKFYNRKKFNFSSLIFIAIFAYIIIWAVIGLKSEKIVGYQVKKGSLAENRIYTGIAIRDEHVVTTDYSGYVSFFVSEGERTSFNNLVYCIDETGKLSDLTGKDPTVDNSLSNSELNSLRLELQLFSKNFDETVFSSTHSIENKVNNQMTQIQNRKIIENVSNINSSHTNDIIDYIRALKPGIVLYYQDGYESYLPSDITKDDFDLTKYECHQVLNDDLLSKGDFVYKYIFNENWSLVIYMSADELMRLENNSYIEVKFSKNQTTSWAKVNVIREYGDEALVELSFTNSMISFCEDRFVEIELLTEDDSGLKIPVSAIGEEEFFLIDKAYVIKEDSAYKVLREDSDDPESGLYKKVEINIYKETDDYYYVDKSVLKVNDKLRKVDVAIKGAESVYIVSAVGGLEGVYNINKGYADFRRVEVKYQNDEYAIIDANLSYGIRAYDFIALDAQNINDKDFVY